MDNLSRLPNANMLHDVTANKAATRLPDVKNNPDKVQLERLSHVYFEHVDLQKFETFAKDFGFIEAWRDEETILYRGYGQDQYCYVARPAKTNKPVFQGPVFVAQDAAEFDKAAAMEGAFVSDLATFPGGGKVVTLKTPAGFIFRVLHGQEDRKQISEIPTAQAENLGPSNGSKDKQRYGEFQRFHPGPALVHKLGHLGYQVQQLEREFAWYTENFNFVPSDVQYLPEQEDLDVISFMHLDLGERYSDHHCLFLARGATNDHDRMHHTSYEVDNFDTQLLGHQWLASKEYRSVWGVGRHILGSQIFDYWRDTSGFTIEHYADGDLVNNHNTTVRSQAGPLAVWGPELPKDFGADGSVGDEVAPYAS